MSNRFPSEIGAAGPGGPHFENPALDQRVSDFATSKSDLESFACFCF